VELDRRREQKGGPVQMQRHLGQLHLLDFASQVQIHIRK
jgi:hypothetical protein